MNPVRVAALAVGLVGAVLIGVLATRQAGPDRVSMHLVGQVAPPVVGTTIDGEVWNLDDQRGRFVVVNFFSTTCVPCIREHPELVAFADAHAEADDVRIVSVAFDDSPAAVEVFFRQSGGGWPVLVEDTGRIAVDWGVVAVPESYLVSPSGHVAAKVVGGVEVADLESLLEGAKRFLE
ncbi:MAG: TlpA disulfide reductase family protein [Acidimicrobiales bacterium]|jgi:cytochrome c biogenesis protein CcmG/thiol:disulfide interchange protein DsbE|nr:TlpA disulfide reductase family protein [Acidimicrobiales bacterium]|tara:strand:+ start:16840 stop:17373 length:534 start_codon:yes stop_codon:yes gene_type:complete